MNSVSYFKRITVSENMPEITWLEVFNLITSDGDVQKATERLRQTIAANHWDLRNPEHKKQYQKLKVELLSGFMPGGTFITKTLDDWVQYSQVVHVDFDDVSIEEDNRLKEFINRDPSVCLSFLSPGGRGRKIFHFVKPEKPITNGSVEMMASFHQTAFGQIKSIYEKAGLLTHAFDDSVSNVNRGCYLSHDAEAYFNPSPAGIIIKFDSETVTEKKAQENQSQQLQEWYYPTAARYADIEEPKRKVENLIQWLRGKNLSITKSYHNWIRVLFALKRSFDDDTAKDLGRQFSQMDSNFSEQEFIKKFNQQIKKDKAPSLGTIFFLAKDLGFEIKDTGINKSVFLENFIKQLSNDKWKIRYNEFAGYLETFSENSWVRFTDMDVDMIKAGLFGHMYRKDVVQETINVIAPRYNPVKQLIENMPEWDGNDHITELMLTLNCEDSKWPLIFIRKWLIGLLAGLTIADQYNENVLILQGDQGDGKTRWIRRLFTEAFTSLGLQSERYFKQKQLNPDNKDDMILLCTSFVVFFDEMNSIVNRKADIEAFKNMTSATAQTIRRPYGHYSEDFRRYASIIATVNESQFLVDNTGNRRFWTISVGEINQNHKVNILQVFAQAYHLLKAGEPHYLSTAEMKELNETYLIKYEVVKAEEEMIRLCVEPCDNRVMTATQIMVALNQLADREIIKCGAANFGKILKKYFSDRYFQNKTGRYYRVAVRSPRDEVFTFKYHEKTNASVSPRKPSLMDEPEAVDSENILNLAGFRFDDCSTVLNMKNHARSDKPRPSSR